MEFEPRSAGRTVELPAGALIDEGRARALARDLEKQLRAADREGRTDFTAKLRVSLDDLGKATVLPEVDTGAPWYVSRISFRGNHKYSDSVLRGALVLAEGEPFDQTRLSRSLVRLGRLGIVEPPTEKSIAVIRDAATRTVAVDIRVKEIAGGRWSLSGPAGTFAMGGSLQGSVMSRLPGWGSGLWELSTYVASVSMTGFGDPLSKLIFAGKIKSFRPYFALQRPFVSSLGWQSGFTMAPQLNLRSHAELYGLTQAQGRIRNLLLSDKAAKPPIVTPVEYEDSRAAGMMLCEERVSPWRHVWGGAVMALEFAAAARSF